MRPVRVKLADPPIGGKSFLIRQKGVFVLEEGPGMLQICNITHGGAGEMSIYDGVPGETGHFPDEMMAESHEKFGQHNGRAFSQFSPVYMGAWMMNAGFVHGLTVIMEGSDVPAFATLVWTPFKKAQPVSKKFEVLEPHPDTHIKGKRIKDVRTPAGGGSLTRSVRIAQVGLTRISRRVAELSSVLVTHPGSFCRLVIRNGLGVPLFDMFSTFTGSFVVGAFADQGIIVDIDGNQQAPLVQVTWREQDLQLV